jgi:hypothetical protein
MAESTVIIIDTSDFMVSYRSDDKFQVDWFDVQRNGDYSPNRYEAQRDAVNIVANAKTEANPESTVALMKMASG